MVAKSKGILSFAVIALMAMYPVHSILNVEIKTLFVLALIYLFVAFFIARDERLVGRDIVISMIVFLLGVVGTIVSGSLHQLYIGLTGAAALMVVSANYHSLTTSFTIERIIKGNFIMLIGAWVAFFYTLLGGPSVLDVINQENDATLSLFLTSFTNSVIENTIRPAGLFDEPGAFAMFSIMTAALNELYYGKRSNTLALLLLNLITFSVMAVFALLLYFVLYFDRFREMKNKRTVFFFLFCTIVFGIYYYDIVSDLLFFRFTFEEGKFMPNNSRSVQVDYFFDTVTTDILFSGHHVLFGDSIAMDSNPFSILFMSGIFVWTPYLVLIVWLAVSSFREIGQTRFAAASLGLLLLQRPYVYSLYWGLLTSYYYLCILNVRNAASNGFQKPECD